MDLVKTKVYQAWLDIYNYTLAFKLLMILK